MDYPSKLKQTLKQTLKNVNSKPASIEFLRTCAVWYQESQNIPTGGPQVMSTLEKQLLETIAFLVE